MTAAVASRRWWLTEFGDIPATVSRHMAGRAEPGVIRGLRLSVLMTITGSLPSIELTELSPISRKRHSSSWGASVRVVDLLALRDATGVKFRFPSSLY